MPGNFRGECWRAGSSALRGAHVSFGVLFLMRGSAGAARLRRNRVRKSPAWRIASTRMDGRLWRSGIVRGCGFRGARFCVLRLCGLMWCRRVAGNCNRAVLGLRHSPGK